MKNVLITGISGFIGRYLYNYRPQNVAVSGTYFHKQPFFQDIALKKLDLLDVNSFVKSEKSCDTIIHTAAQSNLSLCEKDKPLTNQINTESTKILCDWAEQNNSRFIFLSTDIVFDGEKGNYTESDKAEPVNFYGRSKLDAENYIRQVSSNYVIARIALCLGRGLADTKNFIDWFMDKLKSDQVIPLFYDEIRTPTTPQYIARSLWNLAFSAFTGTIHLTGAECLNRYKLGQEIVKYLNIPDARLKKVSMLQDNINYRRPADVSMTSQYNEEITGIKRPVITKNLSEIL